jgi:hypothetical protein
MAVSGPSPSSGIGGAEDAEVCREVVNMGELQMPLQCGLSLQYPLKFSLIMGDLEVEV